MASKCKGSKKVCWCKKDLVERFQHYESNLQEMSMADNTRRISLLQEASPCLIQLLSECGLNVLKGNLKLTDDQYDRLKPHRRMLLKVSKSKSSVEARRSILTKKKRGGFLPIILPIILSALSGFAGQAVSKAIGLS